MSDTLRTRLIRLAHARPDLRPHLLPIVTDRVAMEFDTQEAMDKYLKEHPKADKSKHKVKGEGGGDAGKGGKRKKKPAVPSDKEVRGTLGKPEVKRRISESADKAVSNMKPAARKELASDIGYEGENPSKSLKSFGEWAEGHSFGNVLATTTLLGSSMAAKGALGMAIGAAASAGGLFTAGIGVLLAPIGIYGAAYLYGKMTGENAPVFGSKTVRDNSGYLLEVPDKTFRRTAADAVDPKKLKAVMDYMSEVKPKLQKAIESGKGVGDVIADMYANIPEGGIEVLTRLGQDGPDIVDEMVGGDVKGGGKSATNLRSGTIRLAHTRPDLRPHLLPLVSDHVAASAEDLEVIRVEPTLAGFGRAMMRNLSRGKPYDPREVVSVEVTLSGTKESLVSRQAMYLAQKEAHRHGVYGGVVRRKNNSHHDPSGRLVVTYIVE